MLTYLMQRTGVLSGWLLLAIIGVVVLPITSGDTAMRCCRLMLAEAIHLNQRSVRNRLMLALPVFAVVIVVANLDFDVIWRYFGWTNQTLACFTLWALGVLMRKRGRNHWIVSLPAVFMTLVCVSFLLCSPDCMIGVPVLPATLVGLAVSALFFILFLRTCRAGD